MVPPRTRRRRGLGPDSNQLSFFDPRGELDTLQHERRELEDRLARHEEHRRSLVEALAQAEHRIATAETELATARQDAARVMGRDGAPFRITISVDGSNIEFGDRPAAGEALLAELQRRRRSLEQLQTAEKLGELEGLELKAAVVAKGEGGELILSPAFGGTNSVLYTPANAETDFTLADEPQILIERFEQVLQELPQFVLNSAASLETTRREAQDYRRQLEALSEFDAGRLNELRGRIEAIKIYGDFAGKREVIELERRLAGTAYDRETLAATLTEIDLEPYFGVLSQEELLGLLY